MLQPVQAVGKSNEELVEASRKLKVMLISGGIRGRLEKNKQKLLKFKFFNIDRTHKQVKEHYLNYLRPEINKDEWTLQEDLKLVECLNKYGKDWKEIEESLQGRTQNQIKNRYFGRLKKLAERKVLLKGVYKEIQNSPQLQ